MVRFFQLSLVVAASIPLSGCPHYSPCPTTPESLPERVFFRTATESFNREWYVILREGHICVRPNTETGQRSPGPWVLLGGSGLPTGNEIVRSEEPTEIIEISADGAHLHAISADGRFYRGTDLRREVRWSFNWTDRWGWPAARGPGLSIEFDTERDWSVSDSHPFDVDHYEDVYGQVHSVGLGVAHVYRLGPEGFRIYYNDWWLPADWSRQVCGPERGTFRAISLSVSASTIFVIDGRGRMYTRLYDFDTSGENDLLTYSYLEENVTRSVRALPAEPWFRQPDIEDSLLTDVITIFQTGEGNAARVLRVEGTRDGVTGYFEKPLEGEDWVFVETGAALVGAPLDEEVVDDEARTNQPADDHELSGVLSRQGQELSVGIRLLDFNLFCSPARANIILEGEPVTANGASLELELHHEHGMLDTVRARDYWLRGEESSIRGALLVPENFDAVDDEGDRRIIESFFEERRVVNFRGQATIDSLDLEEIPRSTWFVRPRRESGRQGELFQLRVEVHSTP